MALVMPKVSDSPQRPAGESGFRARQACFVIGGTNPPPPRRPGSPALQGRKRDRGGDAHNRAFAAAGVRSMLCFAGQPVSCEISVSC